jgi:ribonuclease J
MSKLHRPGQRRFKELVFLPLGGAGEIGMNAYLYGYGPEDRRQWLMVDCGITFPEGEFDPGIDVILPDVRFIEENRNDLVGLVITHAHEDHIGAVIELWPRLKAPIYATPFTAGMLRAKLAEYGGDLDLPINVIPLDGRFEAGPFDVELVTLAHSIPEMSALAIRTPLGLVFHTGDWKLDATPFIGKPLDEGRLARLGDEGVYALVIDSTNAFREGSSPSETDVAKSLTEIVKSAKGRVAVTTFSSNVARIKGVARCIVSSRSRARPATCRKGSSITTRTSSAIFRATRSCSCAPAARVSSVPRSTASPRRSTLTSRSARAIWSSSRRAPSPATRRRWGASRTTYRASAATC